MISCNAQQLPTADCCEVGQVIIDELPNDILLYIFNVYVNDPYLLLFYKTDVWVKLVHVSKMAKPHFWITTTPQLQLLCTARTQVTKKLDYKPGYLARPSYFCRGIRFPNITVSISNIIAAIEHYDRACDRPLLIL